MKYAFIVNPAAGKGDKYSDLVGEIKKVCEELHIEPDIHFTTGIGDAEEYTRTVCTAALGEKIRLYACGGDGTFGEVVNGAAQFKNAEVGIVPVGTGNDFVRNFSPKEHFFDLRAQILGEGVKLDLIKYNDRYCANMLNVGFDCEVVVEVAKIKRKKLVPSKLAYVFGVVIKLLELPGVKMKVSFDGGKTVDDRRFLLTTIANGRFCGGGFKSNPTADFNDGLMDLCMIKPVSRAKFVSLVGKYQKGLHLDDEKLHDLVDHIECTSVDFYFDEEHNVGIDGEVQRYNALHIECVPGALNFVLPHGIKVLSATNEIKKTKDANIAYT